LCININMEITRDFIMNIEKIPKPKYVDLHDNLFLQANQLS